tara:strand:+ start:475 stop:663 length:189 start_codon:yes stop_codon:yes gene_type:complete
MNNNHLWTLFHDAHWRSLDNICSHPLEAKDIEDLAEDLGLQAVADQLRSDREEQEQREEEAV